MAYRTQNKESDVNKLQPPQSVETEQEILGAILRDANAINFVIEALESENHFYVPRHQKIYRAVLDLFEKAEPCDITTVTNQLQQSGNLEDIGGRVYLVELVEAVISSANVEAHARIVLEKSVARQLIATSSDIIGSCYAMDRPVEELLDTAESQIFQISEKRQRKGFEHMPALVTQAFSIIEKLREDPLSNGVSSGFGDLDDKTFGLKNGDLIIVAGRPSMGKTALALSIAENVALGEGSNKGKSKGVAIFSCEMSAVAVATRLLCSKAKVSQYQLRSEELKGTLFQKVTKACGELNKAPVFIDETSSISPLEVRSKARRLKLQEDIGLIIVDYIQLMHAGRKAENRQQEISLISRSLKGLARELNVPVIAVSQLSRGVESREVKKPMLSDLRESGAIEQDADLVLLLYREAYYVAQKNPRDEKLPAIENVAQVDVAKHRNGATGIVELSFLKDFARFENKAPGHRQNEIPAGVERIDESSDMPF